MKRGGFSGMPPKLVPQQVLSMGGTQVQPTHLITGFGVQFIWYVSAMFALFRYVSVAHVGLATVFLGGGAKS